MNSNTRQALEIVIELLKGNEISNAKNRDLKEKYNSISGVATDTIEILDLLKIDLYEGQLGELHLSPRIDGSLFSFKSADMKNILKVDNNLELNMCYFIMYCIITLFYKDSSGRAIRQYVSPLQVVEDISLRIVNLSDNNLNINNSSHSGFLAISTFWNEELSKYNINSKGTTPERDFRSKTHIGFVNRVLRFMVVQNILNCDKYTFKYSPTDKMKVIVNYAYNNSTYDYMKKLNSYIETVIVEKEQLTGESNALEKQEV